jgi:hypothetical protein
LTWLSVISARWITITPSLLHRLLIAWFSGIWFYFLTKNIEIEKSNDKPTQLRRLHSQKHDPIILPDEKRNLAIIGRSP